MKTVTASQEVTIPSGVTVSVASRIVTVTGPRGSITKDFKHVQMEMSVVEATTDEEGNTVDGYVKVELWFALRKQLACLRTICSHIANMITGVTCGFLYKM